MRFLITPEIDGIGIYPCSINARILTKPSRSIGFSRSITAGRETAALATGGGDQW
jgi:hypothetical protein